VSRLGRVQPGTGVATQYCLPVSQVNEITSGPDGAIWFAFYSYDANGATTERGIGRMTTDTTAPCPTASAQGGTTTGSSTSGATSQPQQPAQSPTQPGAVPVLGKTAVITPIKGAVRVRLPRTRRFVPVSAALTIPLGSEIDVTRAAAHVNVAVDQQGGTKAVDLSGGRVLIVQKLRPRPLTVLRLSEPLGCGSGARARVAKRKKPTQSSIHASDDGGPFQTEGRHAAGTSRGTEWTTTDTCRATTIAVQQDIVDVRDFERKKTVTVTAGHRYTARARR
jgi:hypothetical protein